MNLPIVIADTTGLATARVVASSAGALVVQGIGRVASPFACARDTGLRVAMPDEVTPLAPPPALADAAVAVAIRERPGRRDLVRVAAGRFEQVSELTRHAAVVHTPDLALAFDLVERHDGTFFVLRMVGLRGELAGLTLPAWLVGENTRVDPAAAWTVTSDATARVVVIATASRIAWITYEALAEVARKSGELVIRPVRIPGIPEYTEVAVVQVVPEGRGLIPPNGVLLEPVGGGRRVIVSSPRIALIASGDRLRLRPVADSFALFTRDEVEVVRSSSLSVLHATIPGTELYPHFTDRVWHGETPGSAAARHLTDAIRTRLERLRELGIAPALEGAALDDAATAAFGTADTVPSQPSLGAGSVLVAHLRAVPQPDTRVVLDTGAFDHAAQANAEHAAAGDPRRFVGLVHPDYAIALVCLTPDERAAIEREDLVMLEDAPEAAPDPQDPAALVAALTALLAIAPGEIASAELAPGDGGGANAFNVMLSVRAAATLERALRYPPEH